MNSKSNTFLNIIIFLAALFLLNMFRGSSVTTVSFDDDALILGAPKDFSVTIEYDQIDTLELVEQFDSGTAVSGSENRKYRWGEWENDTWGQYTLCTTKKVEAAICLTTLDGEIVVFNYEDHEVTTSMYQMFMELLAHRTGTEATA